MFEGECRNSPNSASARVALLRVSEVLSRCFSVSAPRPAAFTVISICCVDAAPSPAGRPRPARAAPHPRASARQGPGARRALQTEPSGHTCGIVRSGRRGGSLTIGPAIRDVGGEGRRMSRAFYNQKLCCRKDTSSCFVRWLRFKRRNARRRAPKRFAEGPREREAEGRRSPTAPPRVAGASVLHVTLSPDRCPHLAGPAPVSNSGQVPEVH